MGSAAGDLLGIFGEGGLWGVGLFRLAMHDRMVAVSRQWGPNSGIMVVDWANLSSEYFRMRVALRESRWGMRLEGVGSIDPAFEAFAIFGVADGIET